MVKNILQIGEPILEKSTSQVNDYSSAETKAIISDLLDTCKENAAISAGLAAPQIGYDKRICVCRRVDLETDSLELQIPDDELWEILINPKLINASDKTSTEWEACLSIGVGDDNIWGPVTRPKKIEVEFTTPAGELKTLKATGYFAHVVQHEIDHLNGILFVSHINNPENLWKLRDLNVHISENDSYPEIQE